MAMYAWRKNFPERDRANNRAWFKANFEREMERLRKRRLTAEGKISLANATAKYRKTQRGIAAAKIINKRYCQSEKGRAKCNAANTKHKLDKKRQTPKWADLEAIKWFYLESERITSKTGIRHHVDHIYPLTGKLVTGLHTHTNLQILTAMENIRKGNRVQFAAPSIMTT